MNSDNPEACVLPLMDRGNLPFFPHSFFTEDEELTDMAVEGEEDYMTVEELAQRVHTQLQNVQVSHN